ncbi:MAG: hypothetical protein GY784_16570 [Gammaproteobacteria bacterium]|nr:hypothetical protein [Gammaproteobacteria bacterium]
MSAPEIINKVWNHPHVLRDDGVGHGDYPGSGQGQAKNNQITYLIFPKMADEREKGGVASVSDTSPSKTSANTATAPR